MTIHFDEDKQNTRMKKLLLDEEEASMQILADKYNISYIDLTTVSINSDGLKLIEEKVARESKVAVFDIVGTKISIAVHSPTGDETKDVLDTLERNGYRPTLFIASIHSLEKAWERYKDISFASETEAGSLDISNEEIENLVQRAKNLEDIALWIKEALEMKKTHRVSKMLSIVMAGALSTKSSDVHIEVGELKARLRYRIDGVLTTVAEFDKETYELTLSRIKLLSGLKLNIKENAQDGRFTVKVKNTDIEIRTSTIPGSYGESVVMRILNPESIMVTMDKLGMSKRFLEAIRKEIARPNGLILTTGPTGSGKTTTLYAFLREVSSPEYKIITIEDPVEYHLPGIVQTQVEESKGYTFEAGLKSAMRQDPDIIMVGEIRDAETAITAINAALTGHLVFSTLHTNNAAGTFTRLIDLGADPKTLTSAIHAAIAQRLVRVLCNKCKKKVPIPTERVALVDDVLESIKEMEEGKEFLQKPTEIYIPAGCDECNNTGYFDRIGIHELILTDASIEKIVRENPSEREIKSVARKQGFLDMRQDGVVKVLQGVTSFDELERVIDLSKDDFIEEAPLV
jgi:type II secretory ATPase GspE/PulE/Tfp pilus assembly ATPase PilB-like protein